MYDGFLELILKGGLPFLFFLIFFESSPFLGAFIPGQFILILLGFLISTTHVYSLEVAIIVVFLGAFLGDLFGFFFAKKYGIDGLKKLGVSQDSVIYRASSNFFKKFGSWSIILGREFNITRAFMPTLAGIFNMRPLKFIILAFISSAVWTVISIYLGYYFGILIIDKLNFILIFLGALIVYLVFVYYIYRSFINLYNENKEVITSYALSNIFYIIFLFLFFIALLLINGFGLTKWFNSYFDFIFLGKYVIYFNFLFTSYFLILVSIFIVFTILFLLKDLKLLIIFIQGVFISSIFTLIFDFLLILWAGVEVYPSVITIVFYIFYIYYIFTHFVNCHKLKKKIEILMGVLLFIFFILKCSITENFYEVLISFIIAAIECELVLILLHYKILEGYFLIDPSKKQENKLLENK